MVPTGSTKGCGSRVRSCPTLPISAFRPPPNSSNLFRIAIPKSLLLRADDVIE